MRRKQIYIAEREELIINGLTVLFQVLPEPVSIFGHGRSAEEVLQDFSVHCPDVLFIDEKIMFHQALPLYPVISDRYPQTLMILMSSGTPIPENQRRCADYCISKTILDEAHIVKLWSDLSVQSRKHGSSSEAFDIRKIEEYIFEHLKEDLTLESIAKEFGYNYTYLSTCFSRCMKKGVNQYINELKIRRACQLLLSKERITISEAGSEAGYSSQSYFTQVFKKYTGCTPRAYQLNRSRYGQAVKSFSPSDASCIPPVESSHICGKCG
ncbi:AraC family transcriptional regulator [Lachnospiraceae bacterium 54-53]